MFRSDTVVRSEENAVFTAVEKERLRFEKRAIVQLGPESEKFSEIMQHYNEWYSDKRFVGIIDLVGNYSELLNMVIDAALEVSAAAKGMHMYSGAHARLYVDCKSLEQGNPHYGGLWARVSYFLERFV